MNEHDDSNHKSLVTIIGGQPFTTTLIIAAGVGNQHKNIIAMVRQYQEDLEEFGPLAFETRMGEPLPQGGFGKATEYATLNERQAGLLLSYMRNTDIVREFKKALIRAFFSLADEVQRLQRQPKAQPCIAIATGDFDEHDRPVVVATKFGNAYVNIATYVLHMVARCNPQSEAHRQMTSAMTARREFAEALPEPFRTTHKLKLALLKSNPLWSDIMHCQRLGLSKSSVARICGCSPSTVKRHLKKMADAGLFDDPMAGLAGEMLELFPSGVLGNEGGAV